MWTQDKEYVDLMRELWGSPSRWNARRTYLDVASKLGVDEETVRNRLRRLRESGYLKGWRVLPNPAVFGRESRMVFLELDSKSKEEKISTLSQMDGVVTVASVYDKGAIVTYFDNSGHEVSRQIAQARDTGSAREIGGMRFPPASFAMTSTDWLIVRLVLRNAERNVEEVAREAKLSARTVRRRLNQMMDASAIAVMPVIDQSKSGGVSYTFIIECKKGRMSEVEGAASSRIGNVGFKGTYSDDGLIFGFFARNVSEGKEFQKWVEGHPGVQSVTMNLVDEVVYAYDWLERETKQRANRKNLQELGR